MKRLLQLLLASFLLISLSSLWAQEETLEESEPAPRPRQAYAKLINKSDPIARYLDWIFIEQGISLPTQTYPLSYEEVRYLLKTKIDKRSLSQKGKELYDQIWDKTQEKVLWGDSKGWVAAKPTVGVDLEAYLVPKRSERDWYYEYYSKRPAMAYVGMEVSLFDHFYTEVVLEIKQDKLLVSAEPNYYSNLPIKGIDTSWPQKAYASVSYPHFNIQGGKNTLNWGNGKSGNLLLSDAPEELSYLQVSTWWRPIKFTALWTFLDNSRYKLQDPDDPNSAPAFFSIDGRELPFLIALTPDEVLPSRFFLAHKLEFAFGPRMNLSFTEAMLYEDYWSDFGFLNPLFLFHNTYLTGHGDYFLSIDIDIALLPGWNLYTQVLLDQVSAGLNRLSDDSKGIPGSVPFLIGTEVVKPFNAGYFTWTFEFVKIDPYAYLDRSSVGLYVDKRWLTAYNGYALHLLDRKTLGYYLGNDLIRLWTRFKWEDPFFYQVWLEVSALFKGENSLFTPWTNSIKEAEKVAPSGKVTTQLALGLGGEISLARWVSGQNLKLKSNIAFLETYYQGSWAWDVQYTAGISWQY